MSDPVTWGTIISGVSAGAGVYTATKSPDKEKTAPVVDDEAARRAKQKQIQREEQGGRASTILDTNKLG